MSKIDLSKKRLQWQCRRGMLELDVLLGRFLNNEYVFLSNVQKTQFAQLLETSDPELYTWLIGGAKPKKEFQAIIDDIIGKKNAS